MGERKKDLNHDVTICLFIVGNIIRNTVSTGKIHSQESQHYYWNFDQKKRRLENTKDPNMLRDKKKKNTAT